MDLTLETNPTAKTLSLSQSIIKPSYKVWYEFPDNIRIGPIIPKFHKAEVSRPSAPGKSSVMSSKGFKVINI